MDKPNSVNVLGVEYKIEYVDRPSDVDIFKRASLFGQVDFWTRTIRIYDNGTRTTEDIWQTILHGILHCIADQLKLKALAKGENHDELEVLALAMTDVLFRNGWMK